jgi:aspartate kinase
MVSKRWLKMEKIVQKFGGTSLINQKSRLQAAQHIQQAKESGSFPVVVVSAMGKSGNPYATDTLINLAKETNNTINYW